ncbi:MAG: hypothetical protein OHK0047_24190 [Leptolyngbyaceae cyanobacterium]|uniref:CRISPR-associated protein Csx18 n=1 Tax=Leptodesmis sichuanensis TaxID=2906798 RepID=UPI001F40A02A|nr:CRISPR-associated protein Csx18 [Leptodesmis sichuanensis]UIE39264.1 hypothetical protein KIK02_06695 [Leptodesmis sichuanensis A121]
MYLTARSAQVRNLAVAAVNGAITLVILLIAPLGLAAVVINTLLVTVATYATATIADRIVRYLQPDVRQAELIDRSQRSSLQRPHPNDLDRY